MNTFDYAPEPYQQHLFYDIQGLSFEVKKDLLHCAFAHSYDWWLDSLNCSESFRRKKVEGIEFKEAMEHMHELSLLSFIHRRGYEHPQFYEVGFRSMESPVDYFLWIKVDLSCREKFLKWVDLPEIDLPDHPKLEKGCGWEDIDDFGC